MCLRLLTARARTRAELAGQLAKRGYPDDVSARVLDRLTDVGLVDDAGFAEQWVHSRRANAGKGKRALAAELHTKGVDNDVITSVLGGINPVAERGRAEQLGQGKENARSFLMENTDVANEIEKKIKEKLGIGAVVTDDISDDSVLPAPVDF